MWVDKRIQFVILYQIQNFLHVQIMYSIKRIECPVNSPNKYRNFKSYSNK